MSEEKTLQLYTSKAPVGSLEAYMQWTNQVPMLTHDEEQELGRRLQEKGDLEAAQQLVMSHLRYVVRIAKSYKGYGLMLSDLIQEGTVGLMKAVKKFQPDKGVRLVSFAVHWIKAEIHEFVIKNWRIVKVATTKSQRKLFFNLRSAKKHFGWFTQEEIQAVANDLGVKPEEVVRMEQRLTAHDTSFELPSIEDDSHALPAPSEYLVSDELDPMKQLENINWDQYTKSRFHTAFQGLDARSQSILQRRWLNAEKETLQDLAEEYGVSPERIRQLEDSAIKKLKSLMLVGPE